jgi:hypothetical protein
VLALLTQGVAVDLELKGAARGEEEAAVTETAIGAKELEAQRARNRRVDIVILPNRQVAPRPPEAESRPIDLRVRRLPGEPIVKTAEPPPWARPQPTEAEPAKVSVCGIWSDTTRGWFDRRLREIGVGRKVREFLAERGVGLVEGLAIGAVGKLAGEAGASQRQIEMIEKSVEAACRQEVRR